MTAPSDSTESRRLGELTELLRDSVQEPSATELQQGLHALRTRSTLGRPRLPGMHRVLLALGVLCSVVLAVVSISYFRERSSFPERPVAVDKIEGGEILDGGYLSEVGRRGIRLLFNEGSKFDLAPGTRGRLRTVTSDGARLAIEHGEASFQITERPNHRWVVEAGPFVVTVRGTVFAVVWDPANEELEVRLKRGRVAVSGPVVGDELLLRPGQTLSVSLPRGETVIKDGRSASEPRAKNPVPPASSVPAVPAAPIASAAAPSNGKQQLGDTPATPGSATVGPPGARWWKEAIATGQWDRILADVDREGVAANLQSLSSEDLFALADAARYRRRADLARAALLEQRRRFPNSPRALDALFLLGRVEEQGQGGRQAIRRYDDYLARAPGGTYAAEALGRRMILTKDVEGPASARRIAAEYLRRFPNGSYAEAARALRQIP